MAPSPHRYCCRCWLLIAFIASVICAETATMGHRGQHQHHDALHANDNMPMDGKNGHHQASQSKEQRQQRQRRRMKVAPLNQYLLTKDEFDKKRGSIENFVFQTLDAFSTTSDTDTTANNSNSNSNNNGSSNNNSNKKKGTSPSRLYTYTAFFESLRSISVDGVLGQSYQKNSNPYIPGYDLGNNDYQEDPTNMAFFLSQDDPLTPKAIQYAIVNICAFLSQVMVESIQFDACEEFNGMVYGSSSGDNNLFSDLSELNGVNGRYFPMSNACGQFGKSYNEQCPMMMYANDGLGDELELEDVSCTIDTSLEVTAVAHPRYNYDLDGANSNSGNSNSNEQQVTGDQPPPPFYCMPKQYEGDYGGYWDGYNVEFVRRVAYPSTLGKISVEGCCYWGRAALMTKGSCGLGRINHFMGMKAYDDGRPSRYPEINFCKIPSMICGQSTALLSGVAYPELKFMVALFDWVERIQSYSNGNSKWNYLDQLKFFVDGGMTMEGTGKFIDAVSSVVTRGCDGMYCSQQTIHFVDERKKNFETLIHDIFNLRGTIVPDPKPQPKYDFDYAMRWLGNKRSKIEGNIIVSKNDALNGVSYFSQTYKFEPLMSALRTTSFYGLGDQRYFFLGDETIGLRGFNAGLINLAFFLANAMSESITGDSCDEMHWAKSGSKYPISNSCGQNGRDYGSETCPAWQSFMTCDVNKEAVVAAEAPTWQRPPFLSPIDAQPPPFQCRPGTDPAGYWDESTKRLEDVEPFPNSYGRVVLDGCCFWGRGSLSTRGSCNYGKLNFHIGAQAAAENRPAIYPDIDFCSSAEMICSDKNEEIRYVVGLFEWIDRVQDYYDSMVDWSYKDELYKFVDEGMDDDVFIDAVSNIVSRGCHVYPCTRGAVTSVSFETNRPLYGIERRMNFKNILRLVFELPVQEQAASNSFSSINEINNPPAESTQTKRPTYRPTPYPSTELPTKPSPAENNSPGLGLITGSGTFLPTKPRRPTGSPIEVSDVTVYNDGGIYMIGSEASSITDESIVLTNNSTLILEEGGYIEAPLNTDWPAIRLTIGSSLIARGGYVNGSYADPSYLEGDYEDGGEAIHVNNGQSGPETASYAEFYEGVHVIGGDAPDGIGGNALHVNGFGTETIIYGGRFTGGIGVQGDGLSVYALNSGAVQVRGGVFEGDMRIERRAKIAFYGCFKKVGTRVTGVFVDESELDVRIRTYYGGEVLLIPLAEQECDIAPSSSPTNFPTLSPQPTVPRPNPGNIMRAGCLYYFVILAACIFLVNL